MINSRAPKDGHRELGVPNTHYIKFKRLKIVKLSHKTKESIDDRTFSAGRELLKKLLTPDTLTYSCVLRGKKGQFLGKFCVHIKWRLP